MESCINYYEAETASRLKEYIQPLPPHPTSHQPEKNLTTSLEQTFYQGDIQKYTDICFQKALRMQFLGVREMVHCKCFFNTKQTHV